MTTMPLVNIDSQLLYNSKPELKAEVEEQV